ncbi:hypothetical protein HHK36_013085 [Tetracentron sinense]|uniref:Ninja-family protein n=1 Tax=Tetracentron sinense TaxID=13715 RepID=A0A835DG53_TETSI|nr:hypothetical protein HHK36_013085 [Tetracentron sinense]
MADGYSMVEVSGLEVEEEEVELSLGLSIGRSFRKSEKLKIIQQKLVSSPSTMNRKACQSDTDLRGNDQSFCRSNVSPVVGAGEEKDRSRGGEFLDPLWKREIHAMRRQEARKKTEQKKVVCRGRNGVYLNGGIPIRTVSMGDKMWLEAQEFQSRVRDREMKENEANRSERISKKVKAENGDTEQQNGGMKVNHNQTLKKNIGSNPSAFPSPPFPVGPIQFPFSPVQYVPFANGFTYPYAMPCWAPPAGPAGDYKNVFQPVACRTFRPFRQNSNHSLVTNCNLGQTCSNCDGVKQGKSSPAWSESRGSSSSSVSDYQSGSQQGGSSSSDTRSHSSRSSSEQSQLHASIVSNTQGQPEYTVSSLPIESTQGIGEVTNYTDKVVSSSITQSTPRKTEDESISVTENPPPHPLKEAKGDGNKPQSQPLRTQSLPQMPCVSTTGNGPNGKTITGFLYRYTKTEVSIVCVCHGSSFSPAEFVQHAGGTDISHPLRHITVVPSAFG